jgi:hypothetical protein
VNPAASSFADTAQAPTDESPAVARVLPLVKAMARRARGRVVGMGTASVDARAVDALLDEDPTLPHRIAALGETAPATVSALSSTLAVKLAVVRALGAGSPEEVRVDLDLLSTPKVTLLGEAAAHAAAIGVSTVLAAYGHDRTETGSVALVLAS